MQNLLSCNIKININADIISIIYVITFHIKRSIVDGIMLVWLSLWCEHQISLSENEINAPQTYKECDYMLKDVYTW